ncbi:MAG TPA: alpha/beta fold hydrolase, partial [bacterium]|nr:alpha/beta fold hydrolase [bacterium]
MQFIKSLFLSVVLIILTTCSSDQGNQSLEGLWQGILKYPGFELRIVFKIEAMPAGTLQASVLMPDQNDNEIPVTTVIMEDSGLYLEVASINGSFEGRLLENEGIIDGQWKQGVRSQPLVLRRVSEISIRTKPQTPIPPYPYNTEDVTFVNSKANVELAGTLSWPEQGSPYPAVILIPGTGAHDRDYSMMGHRPFLVISDYLTRRDIAVLRYDERGVGASTGERSQATSEDYAMDVLAGVEYLAGRRQIDPDRIGLIGHSEGGTIASLAAASSQQVAFIVMMASPGLPGVEYNLQFEESMGRVMGLGEEVIAGKRVFQERVFNILLHEKDLYVAKNELRTLYAELNPELPEERIQSAIARFLSPW